MRLSRLVATAFALSVMAAVVAAQQAPAGGGQRGGAPSSRLARRRCGSCRSAFIDGGLIPAKFTQAGAQASPQTGVGERASDVRRASCCTCTTWKARATRPPRISCTGSCGTSRRRQPRCPKDCQWAGPQGRQSPDERERQRHVSRPRSAARPARIHHYVFELFALDTKIDVPANPMDPFETRAKVLAAIQGHVVGKRPCISTVPPAC